MLLYYITDRRQFPGDERAQRGRLLDKIAEATRWGVDFIQLREKDLCPRELESLAREAVQMMVENSPKAATLTGVVARAPSPPITPKYGRAGDPGSPAAVYELSLTAQRGSSTPGAGFEEGKRKTRLLINSRSDIALACGADGVHLTSADISASDARVIWSMALCDAHPAREREKLGPASSPTGNWQLATGNWFIAVSCHTPAEIRMAEAHGADFAVFAPVFEKATSPPRPGIGLAALREACAGAAAAKNVEGVAAGRMPVLALGGVTLENARACLRAGAAGIAAIRLFQENDIARIVEQLRKA